ncbi:MAG: mannose-1-phosphate guanylyltransferase [Anaerolineaceae bacterium]|nr:mannose-1-phosphate guanylyltransferase [Anaerolineaceae bacterium]
MEHFYAMIMAGGGGTRLWPMSRQDTPKQLLPLVEDDSMFKVSVSRLAPLFKPEQIYVVTGRMYFDKMHNDVPEIPLENFIIEPYGRDTAPAAALGLTVIHERDPQAVVAILTADHHITKKEKFRDVLAASYELANSDCIVTLGLAPTYPATGFGYIRQGESLTEVNGFSAYHSLGFTEKPDEATATSFIESGQYSWNSGMFIWKTSTALNEFQRQQPEMYDQFQEIAKVVDTAHFEDTLESIWDNIRKISLDFAVMEHAQNIVVIPTDIGWNDVGSWGALFEVLKLDKHGNHYKGKSPVNVIIDTQNTLVYSDKLTVTIGIENLIIVETQDALLLCHKDRTQDVKEVVNKLLTNKNYKYL